MSDLSRVVKLPRPAPFRIVLPGPAAAVVEYAYHIESAKAFAELLGGEIETYTHGIGWVPWLPPTTDSPTNEADL